MLHTRNPIIKHKAGFLNPALELQNLSKACKIMGISRDTFIDIKNSLKPMVWKDSSAKKYQYSYYDSQILASALSAECSTLFTKDMQHG